MPLPTDPVLYSWMEGNPAPESIASFYGSATASGRTVYFSQDKKILSYQLDSDKWSVQQCQYSHFSLAVIKDKLVSIGGHHDDGKPTSAILYLTKTRKWENLERSMPTPRILPAVATTSSHLVVAGGKNLVSLESNGLTTIEVMNISTLQWTNAGRLPGHIMLCHQMTISGDNLYISNSYNNAIFSCSTQQLLQSELLRPSTWTRLRSIPQLYGSSLVTCGRHLLAVGGVTGKSTGSIYSYNKVNNLWRVIGKMPTPRYNACSVYVPSNDVMVVVGGYIKYPSAYAVNEIVQLKPPEMPQRENTSQAQNNEDSGTPKGIFTKLLDKLKA